MAFWRTNSKSSNHSENNSDSVSSVQRTCWNQKAGNCPYITSQLCYTSFGKWYKPVSHSAFAGTHVNKNNYHISPCRTERPYQHCKPSGQKPTVITHFHAKELQSRGAGYFRSIRSCLSQVVWKFNAIPTPACNACHRDMPYCVSWWPCGTMWHM